MDFLLLFGKVDALFLERRDEGVLPFCVSYDITIDIFVVFQIPTLRKLLRVATSIPIDENPAILRVQNMMLHSQIDQLFASM